MFFVGIDEAGRGPVLGPLIIAGVKIHKENIPILSDLGVKDSKKLTPRKREELMEKIKSYAEHILIMNTHIPEFLNNDSELRKQILATFEETPNDLQDEEFFDHYFSVCEKALDVVRDHNFEVIIY